jgi:signal transduction histidine kinase
MLTELLETQREALTAPGSTGCRPRCLGACVDLLAMTAGLLDGKVVPAFDRVAADLGLVDLLDGMKVLRRRLEPLLEAAPQGPGDLDRVVSLAVSRVVEAKHHSGDLLDRVGLEHLPLALLLVDTEHQLSALNPRGRALLRRLGGPRCHEALFGRDAPCAGCELERVLGEGREARCEGVVGDTGLTIRLLPHGSRRALIVVQEGPRRSACQILQRTHLCMLENVGSGMLLVDRDGQVVYCNTTAEELLGITPAHGLPLARVLPGVSLTISDEQRTVELTDEGASRLLGYRCVEVEEGTLITFRDVTQLERMRADMKRLEQLSEAGRMASVMAHEIRNPLAGIRALAESIAGEVAQLGLGYAIDMITEEVDRLDQLLKEYGVLTRHRPPRRQPASLKDVVEAARVACGARLDGRELVSDLDSPRRVWVDADQVKQVLINLLLNAAEATRPGGRIAVRLRHTAETAVLEVQDDGAGIPGHSLPRVMDAFFTTKAEGSGLGLAVCFRIVNDHGGRLEVASEVGEGTTVTATFPDCEPK